MKKSISLILTILLIFTSTASSYANTKLQEDSSYCLIEDTVKYLVLTSDGMVNIDKTFERKIFAKYSENDISEMKELLGSLNSAMIKKDIYVNNEKSLVQRNNNHSIINIVPFYQGSYEYISPGAYDVGNNYIHVYFDRYQTQEMINNRQLFASPGLIFDLLFTLITNVPLAIILVIAQNVSAEEADQISSAFTASGNYGVYYRYWKYTSGSRTWLPWFAGQVVGSNWIKLY